MCQRVYVACRGALPTVRRGAQSPFLEVQVAPPVPHIRGFLQLDLPNVYLAGGHVVCGCGFPDLFGDDVVRAAPIGEADVQSLRALVEWLRPAVEGHKTARLYLCWPHRQHDPPQGERTVTVTQMLEAGFRLRHHEILTIGSVGEPRRRPTKG